MKENTPAELSTNKKAARKEPADKEPAKKASADEELVYRKESGVATLIFNRLKSMNAITPAMAINLERYLIDIAADDSVRVVVLTGAGGSFCAGAELKPEAKQQRAWAQSITFPGDRGGDILDRCNRCILRLQALPKPVLASISGSAVGIGCSLALAADLRIASSSAELGVVFSKIGLGPDGGASYFLNHLVGSAKALELLFLGDKISANQAYELGLLNWVVEADELKTAAMDIIERLAKGPTLAYAMAKNAVYQSRNLSLESTLDLEARNQRMIMRTQDAKEGIQSFLERRKPNFLGR